MLNCVAPPPSVDVVQAVLIRDKAVILNRVSLEWLAYCPDEVLDMVLSYDGEHPEENEIAQEILCD
eukprot:1802290-Karenia_brevis.AAC.1